MARHAAEQRGSRWLRSIFIGLAAVCGLGAAAVIIPPMMFEPSSDVALIKAEQGPFKLKPKDAGGVDIPHQDTTVMGMIGGLVEQQNDVEILRPPSAVPEMPPTPAGEETVQAAPEPVAPDPVAPETAVQAASQAWPQIPEDPVSQSSTGGRLAQADNSTVVEEAGVPAATEDTATAMAMPTSKPQPPRRVRVEGDDPLYLVQLAAFREVATAREQAGLLNAKHRGRLAGAELGTMKSDSGGDGIFWRVVTEPLPRAEADQICASLKRAGQDCILRKFDAAAG